MNNTLFDGSDDEGDDLQLGTNQDYAKSYNSLRKRELLQKYKDRGLDVSESEFDSDSESSEEEVDPKFDQDFFKTLASLKSKDPRIYDKQTHFFANEESDSDEQEDANKETQKKKNNKSKPVTLKDYERNVILEHNGKFESSDEEQTEEFERAQSPTAVEEERRLKAEFRKVMNQEDDGADEEFGGIFKKRTKTKAQQDAEEADFAKWLAGKQADAQIADSDQKQLEPLKQYWTSNKLTQGESFLRDYILNKGYANTDASEIPTYDEIVNTPLSEDEQELEKQAEFEQKYNFRFEEPDADFLKRYPRTIEQSIRRTDDKRKEKRKETKERKEQEKQQKMKELDMIKEMKRKEIEDKIRKLKAVTGNEELGFKDDELDEDFDPAAHDRRMQELFNDDYYNVDEGEEKPECPSDIEELAMEDWDNYDPQRAGGDDDDLHCEDDDFNMDCEYDPSMAKQQLQQELIENTRSRKGRKGRRNQFKEMIQAKKPVFNPEEEQTYAEYIDEYYKMDYEDIVGDQPCRFKYVETTPNDFGLTIEEILLAKNKELNQWASLKKAVQYRPDHVEKKEQRLYKMKGKNEDLKRKIFKSLYGEESDDEEQTTEQSLLTADTEAKEQPKVEEVASERLSKSKRKRLKRKAAATATTTIAKEDKHEKTDTVKSEETTMNETTTPDAKKQKLEKEDTSENPIPSKKNNVKKQDQGKILVNQQKNLQGATVIHSKFNSRDRSTNKFKAVINNDSQTKEKAKKELKRSSSNPFHKPHTSRVNRTNLSTDVKNRPTGNNSSDGNNPFKRSDIKTDPFEAQEDRKFKTKGSGRSNSKFRSKPNTVKGSVKGNNRGNSKFKSNPNGVTDDRLKAYGINPRKFHNQQKYGKKQN
ncbi:CG5645, partial [Drosophila busckii]